MTLIWLSCWVVYKQFPVFSGGTSGRHSEVFWDDLEVVYFACLQKSCKKLPKKTWCSAWYSVLKRKQGFPEGCFCNNSVPISQNQIRIQEMNPTCLPYLLKSFRTLTSKEKAERNKSLTCRNNRNKKRKTKNATFGWGKLIMPGFFRIRLR